MRNNCCIFFGYCLLSISLERLDNLIFLFKRILVVFKLFFVPAQIFRREIHNFVNIISLQLFGKRWLVLKRKDASSDLMFCNGVGFILLFYLRES